MAPTQRLDVADSDARADRLEFVARGFDPVRQSFGGEVTIEGARAVPGIGEDEAGWPTSRHHG
jgi:hypothetical protein